MALKRRDVIIACAGICAAWVFATNWAPSLRWVIYAFLLGVAWSICAVLSLLVFTSRGVRYGQLNRISRPKGVAFMAADIWKAEVTALGRRQVYKKLPIYADSFIVHEAMEDLLTLVVRDFVRSWYGHISTNPVFSNEVDKTIRLALGTLRDRILSVEIVETITSRVVPIITAHLKEFYDAEKHVRGKHLNLSVTESEELDLAIAGRYNNGKLHPAASLAFSNTKLVQQEFLENLVTTLLPKILPEHVITSRTVSCLVRELVACAVLQPVMQLLSDPDTWNQIMEGYVSFLCIFMRNEYFEQRAYIHPTGPSDATGSINRSKIASSS